MSVKPELAFDVCWVNRFTVAIEGTAMRSHVRHTREVSGERKT